MAKVRFACPRCQTIMQTGAEKVGYDVACPHCAHRFRLVDSSDSESGSKAPSRSLSEEATMPPSSLPGSSGQLGEPLRQSDLEIGAVAGSRAPAGIRSNKPEPITGPVVSQYPVSNSRPEFRCPYCQTTRAPKWKSEVSQIGWIVFAILLVTTCVCCWVGLFIRDKYRVCSQCNIRLD